MKLIKSVGIIFCIVFLLVACNKKEEEDAPIPVEFVRFDQELMALDSKEELEAFLKKNPWYTKALYRTFPDDTAFVDYLYNIISHPGSRAFFHEVDSTFGNLDDLKSEFSGAFGRVKTLYPDFTPPKIYITFTGLETDMFVDDSTVIISLEAFAGPRAKYRPDQPDYILRRYQKSYIVPAVMRLLADSYIKSTPEPTMLNDMVYFGKSYAFVKEVLPGIPDSLIIGMPDSSLNGNWYAQDIIWAHFIDKGLLFEQNRRVKEKYLGERPKVPEIGTECPGRVGQWLGWRIIDKFLRENPDVTFTEMMKMEDPQEILKKSNYRGEADKN
jgi:hypothetical protein